MRRLFAVLAMVVALAALATGVWAVVDYVDRDDQYQRLLADGERAAADGSTYAAIEKFSGAIALREDSMVAFYRRGEAYVAQQRFDLAERDLLEATRLRPDAPQPYIALGRLHEQKGDFARAAAWYGTAAERLKAEDPALLYTLALALYRGGGSPAAAEKPLLQALARQDAFPEAHYLLGLVRRDTQNIDQAIASLEYAVRLAPDLIAAREELADLYRVVGRPVDEMRHLQALAQQDNRTERRVAIALSMARHEQFGDAVGTLTQTAERDPNDSRVQLALGRVHLARAEHAADTFALAEARTALEKALGGTARRSEGLALYGRVLFLSGEVATAERILLDAVATTPVDPEAFGFLADASERLSHSLEARDALINLDVLQGDTVPPDVRTARALRIGSLSLRANDARLALPYLTQAHDGGYSDSTTLGLLARARWLTGDTAGAQDALTRALALDPTDQDLLRLQRQIR